MPCLLLELCAGGIDDVQLAADLGVDRIELNSGMPLGGLTPSAGLVLESLAVYSGPIICMLRPREGGFRYSSSELRQMFRDAEWMLAAGVAGIAAGFLDASGNVDTQLCGRLRQICGEREFVFHKAFDWTWNLSDSLQSLIDSGVDRILTSGGKPTAVAGALALRKLISESRNRVQILAGGGIQADNLRQLLEQSGCTQVHAGLREFVETEPQPGLLHFGVPGSGPRSYSRTAPQKLRGLAAAIRSYGRDEWAHFWGVGYGGQG